MDYVELRVKGKYKFYATHLQNVLIILYVLACVGLSCGREGGGQMCVACFPLKLNAASTAPACIKNRIKQVFSTDCGQPVSNRHQVMGFLM